MDAHAQRPSGTDTAPWLRFSGLISALAIVFGGVAIRYVQQLHLGLGAAIGIYGCFLLLLTFALLPGTEAGQGLTRRVQTRWTICLLLCIPYLLYAFGTGDFRLAALVRVAAVAFLPAVIYWAIPSADGERFSIGDLCVAVCLIAVVLRGWLRPVWRVPVNLDFMGRLLLIAVASSAWSFVRPVPHLHYRFRFSVKVLKAATLNFLYFAAIAT